MRRFITVCFFFSSLAVFADPGDLDLSFGNKTGMATMTNFEITGIIQQSDGKLVT